jgi:hypothetical protein
MLRLVAPSLEGDPVRCRVTASALRGDPAREQLVALLVRARLVTTEEDAVELAHEALARAWPRLRSWLDEDAAGQRMMRHLAAAADGWESLGRPDSELYRGARLDATVEWRTATTPDLTATEIAFLDASLARRRAEEADLAARAEAQQRNNRRLRAALGGVAALLAVALAAGAVALAAGAVAFSQQRRATENEREASLGRLVSTSAALRGSQRDLAALLAVEAHRLTPSADTESALFGIMSSAPGLERTVRPAEQFGGDGLLVDEETMALSVAGSGTVYLVDVESGVERGRLSMGDDEGAM